MIVGTAVPTITVGTTVPTTIVERIAVVFELYLWFY